MNSGRTLLTTAYDIVEYPSIIHARTHPDRHAALAMLHGLTPPPVETARVLEVACGDGRNLMALAAAYPKASFEGFDLAETAIASGCEVLAASGLANVSLSARDLLDAREAIAPGSFDYIIAHGLYAWVPEPVRAALMDLMGHALSPGGIGFVSYNALPGGHFRTAMRDMLLHEFGHISDPEARVAAAFDFLKPIAEAEPSKNAAMVMYRDLAKTLLDRDKSQLFHDELGEFFAPQTLTSVVSAAQRVGLRYLCDVEPKRLFQTFLEPDDDDEDDIDRAVVRTAQSIDYREACFFRCSLFVRNTVHPSRLFDPNLIEQLWISTPLTFAEAEGQFRHGDKQLKLSDERMTAAFHRISAAGRGRIPFAGLVDDEVRRQSFIRLFSFDYVDLHTGPAPFVSEVGERPMSSPLVRAEIALGRKAVARLDHTLLEIDQPHLRALLSAADGSRTIAETAHAVDGVFPAADVLPALNAAAARALMSR